MKISKLNFLELFKPARTNQWLILGAVFWVLLLSWGCDFGRGRTDQINLSPYSADTLRDTPFFRANTQYLRDYVLDTFLDIEYRLGHEWVAYTQQQIGQLQNFTFENWQQLNRLRLIAFDANKDVSLAVSTCNDSIWRLIQATELLEAKKTTLNQGRFLQYQITASYHLHPQNYTRLHYWFQAENQPGFVFSFSVWNEFLVAAPHRMRFIEAILASVRPYANTESTQPTPLPDSLQQVIL